MNLSPTLLRWLLRPLLPMSTVLSVLSIGGALFWPSPFHTNHLVPSLVIIAHSILCASFLYWGWNGTSAFGFIQSRGFSAKSLWAHRLAAASISALMVWLPLALATWTPLRGWLQGDVLANAYYPFMALRDGISTLQWLGLYLLFIPAAQYAWIRQAQPCRFPGAGHWFVMALPVLIVCLATFPSSIAQQLPGYLFFSGAFVLCLATLFLVAGYRLTKTLELSLS